MYPGANALDSRALIPLAENDGETAVMGRDLHTFLEVESNYTTWFARMIAYGFSAGQDFIPKMEESSGGRPSQDHILTLDMAKEISMIQRSEKGKQARQYFIECERMAKGDSSPAIPQSMSEALRLAADEHDRAELEKARADEQAALATRSQKALEVQAPMVAKATAHSGVEKAIGRQMFARQVQQYGETQGIYIKQNHVYELLGRHGMCVRGNRKDRGHITATAVRSGWGWNETGISEETGYEFTKPLMKKKGQDIAWKWVYKDLETYGVALNPPAVKESVE